MKLTILGSGTVLINKNRRTAGFLVETGKAKFLLDCGHNILSRLIEFVDIREIEGIFISHFHSDHLGDAFNLADSRFVASKRENKETSKITFWGPKGLAERYQKFMEIYWDGKRDYPIEFIEGEGKYNFKDINFELFPVHHVSCMNSLAIKLEMEGKKVIYVGDLQNQDAEIIVEKCQKVDLLLIEPGFPPIPEAHFSLEKIKEVIEKSGVKKVVIVHLFSTPGEVERINKFFAGDKKIIIGEDRMTVEV